QYLRVSRQVVGISTGSELLFGFVDEFDVCIVAIGIECDAGPVACLGREPAGADPALARPDAEGNNEATRGINHPGLQAIKSRRPDEIVVPGSTVAEFLVGDIEARG